MKGVRNGAVMDVNMGLSRWNGTDPKTDGIVALNVKPESVTSLV